MRVFVVVASLLLPLAAAGCAVGEPRPPSAEGTPGTPSSARGVYVPVRANPPVSKTNFQPGGAPLPIYLNPRGGTYTGGSDDASLNRSSVVASTGRAEVTIPAWDGDVAAWDALVACVALEFDAFNVSVTDVEPASGPYLEAVIGGSGGEVGMSGYASVAPIDTAGCRLIDRAVVFVFSAKLADVRSECEAAAAAIGHAASLDHTFSCQDPMSYLGGCGERSFQDSDMACGELAERPCVCGRAQQNSVELLRDQLGARESDGGTFACDGLSYAGSCSATGVLSWCDAGHVRTLDCAASELDCGDSGNPQIGNDCKPRVAPDACMGIDFLGQCSDTGVLSYCLNGQLETIDCAAIGQSCAYVDDAIGFTCVVPPAVDNCGGIDFIGQCSADAAVLSYCQNGQLQVIDCAALGRVCGFADPQVGFACLVPPAASPGG